MTEKDNDMTLAKVLQMGYLDWLSKRGEYASQADFAMMLGVNAVAFNRHYNGRTIPQKGDPAIEKYAAYFGDVIFDTLGLARQNELFKEFTRRYDETPADRKLDLLRLIDDFLNDIGARQVQ